MYLTFFDGIGPRNIPKKQIRITSTNIFSPLSSLPPSNVIFFYLWTSTGKNFQLSKQIVTKANFLQMARTKCTSRINNLSPRSRKRLDAELEENERFEKAKAEAKKAKRKAVFLNFIQPQNVVLILCFFWCIMLHFTQFYNKNNDPNLFFGNISRTNRRKKQHEL